MLRGGRDRSARRYAATTGGASPRRRGRADVPVIGLPGGFSPATRRLRLHGRLRDRRPGGVGGLRTEIDAAAAHLEDGATRWSPRGRRSPSSSTGRCR